MGETGREQGDGWPLTDVRRGVAAVMYVLVTYHTRLQKVEEKIAMLEGRLEERVEGGDDVESAIYSAGC